MDPENHKCRFAIMFSVAKEINRSEPIGIALGMIMGLCLELLRQMEKMYKPKVKLLNPTPDKSELSYDEDEEKISLISMKIRKGKGYDLDLKTDSDEDHELTEEQLMMRGSIDFHAKF